MKKKKTIAYIMAAMLLVGGTFVGTKAYFTDRVDAGGELFISTGDLDLELKDEGQWTVSRRGQESGHGTKGVKDDNGKLNISMEELSQEEKGALGKNVFVNNLKPYDKIEKKVIIRNNGTLVATNIQVLPSTTEDIRITANNGNTNVLLDATTSKIVNNTLKPGEEMELTLTLQVKDFDLAQVDHNNRIAYNSDGVEDTVIDLQHAWILSAEQQK